MDITENNKKDRKEYLKEYMRDYMRKRNIKNKVKERRIMTPEEIKEKVKQTNRMNYMKNREKSLEYARNKREAKTGKTRIDRIKKIFNTLSNDEKELLKVDDIFNIYN